MSDFDVVFVVNRTSRPYETMFDGKVLMFKPQERKAMVATIARNIYMQSYSSMTLTSGLPSGYRLGIEGETDCDPIEGKVGVELLDRTGGEKLQHSHPQVLTKEGLEPLQSSVGSSPVSTPVSMTLLSEAQASGEKPKTEFKPAVAKFDNPIPRPARGVGAGTVTSKTA